MDLFGRFKKLDSSLQRGLDNGFARVFGGEVVPTEIDEVLKQQAEESVMIDSRGQQLAPSYFRVLVSDRDYGSLTDNRPRLTDELNDRLSRFIRNQGWHANGPIQVDVESHEDLHSGQLRVDARFNAPKKKPSSDATAGDTGEGASAVSHDDSASGFRDEERFGGSPDGSYPDSYPGQQMEAPADRPEWPQRDTSHRASVAHDYDVSRDSGGLNLENIEHGESREVSEDIEGIQNSAPDAAPHADATASAGPHANASAAAGSVGLANLVRGNSPRRHPGESAYSIDGDFEEGAADGVDDKGQSEGPISYPGTEVIAQSVPEEPVRGGTGEPGADSAMTVTLTLRDGSDRTYQLQHGSNLIGRGNGVDLRIPDTGVSRQHADIAWDGFDAVLTDLQSTNGTTVNEIPVENWLLADGDVISLGHSDIDVRFS